MMGLVAAVSQGLGHTHRENGRNGCARNPIQPVFLRPMRLILLLILMSLAPGLTEARRLKPKKLPLPLLEVFHIQHPAAVKAVWTADGSGFRVRFSEFGRAVEVTYDQAQQWTLRKRALYDSELPVAADRYLQSSHTGCSAVQIVLWQRPGEPDRIRLRLSCPNRTGQMMLDFDAQGNVAEGHETPEPTPAGTGGRKKEK